MAEQGNLGTRLQAMSVPDRRMFLETMLTLFPVGANLDRLLKFLQSDDVVGYRAGEQDWGPLKVIEDMLRAYPKFCEDDEAKARQLYERFLYFIFTQQQQLDINNVFVWLQTFRNNKLLEHAVESVCSEGWLPPGSNPRELKQFQLKCRRSRASIWRRQRRYLDADSELQLLLDAWQRFDPREVQEISVIEYEIGYSAYLQGRIQEAVTNFSQGARHAAEAGDRIGELIDSFNSYMCQFEGRTLAPEKAKMHFEEHRNALLQTGVKEPRVDAWLYTINTRLFEVACELQETSRVRQMSRQLADDPYLTILEQEHRRHTPRLLFGRAAVVCREWKAALEQFAPFVDADLSRWGTPDPDLVKFASERDENAVSYRDAGIALRELSELALARQVWERGLEKQPKDYGNTFFHEDIRRLIDQQAS